MPWSPSQHWPAHAIGPPWLCGESELAERFGDEELVDLPVARQEMLLAVVAQAGLESLAVPLDAVGPEIIAHEPAIALLQRGRPGDHQRRREEDRAVAIDILRRLLRLLERIRERARDPGIFAINRALDHDRMHNRENLGTREIIALDGLEILEQPADLRRAGAHRGRYPGREQRVDFAIQQHLV